MADYDLVIRGGTVVTPPICFAPMSVCVVVASPRSGEAGGRPTALDADGLLVMPGGVDTHCHIEQLRPNGGADEETLDDRQHLRVWPAAPPASSPSPPSSRATASWNRWPNIADARAKAMVDYTFHQIITDATDEVIFNEVPQVVASGVRSLKVFLTYDPLHLDDRQFIRVLAAARRTGAFVTVHCENYDAINWRTAALLADGRTAPKYHAWSRPSVIEREATHRAIALAEMVDQPIQVFHVSCPEVAEEIARAKSRGLKVWGEDLPAVFRSLSRPYGPARLRGRQVHVQSSAARCRSQRGSVENDVSAARWMLFPRIIAAGATKRLSANGCTAQRAVPRYSEWGAWAWLALADRVQRGRLKGPHRPLARSCG